MPITMTLYGVMYGENPHASELLRMLDIPSREWCGRFRDCYVQRESDGRLRIHVLTRNGGGNRIEQAINAANQRLRTVAGYATDFDEECDMTYASFVYEISGSMAMVLQAMVARDSSFIPKSFAERSADFKRLPPDDPEVLRAHSAVRPWMDKLVAIFARGERAAALVDSDAGISGPNIVKLGDDV